MAYVKNLILNLRNTTKRFTYYIVPCLVDCIMSGEGFQAWVIMCQYLYVFALTSAPLSRRITKKYSLLIF